jgi:hypothetical protein
VIGRVTRLHLISKLFLHFALRTALLVTAVKPHSLLSSNFYQIRTSAIEQETESNRHLLQAFGIPRRATLPSISDKTACFLTACEIASHRPLHSGRKPTYT